MSSRRYVFLAAIGRYSDPACGELPGVRPDAERLASVLQTHGDGELVRFFRAYDSNATKEAVLETIDRVVRLAETTSQIVIYLAGHGGVVQDDDGGNQYFFLPFDVSATSVREGGISTRDIAAALGKARASEIVLILDFCHSGGMPTFEWIEPVLADPRRRCCIMAATHRAQIAAEHGGGGYFTAALTNALEGKGIMTDRDGRVSAQKAWSYAAEFARDDAARDDFHQSAVAYLCGPPIFVTRPVRAVEGSIDRVVRIYPTSLDEEFHRDIRRLLGTSRSILFVGTGLSVLSNEETMNALVERARVKDVKIDICLANPYNPSVQDRLIEEEMRDQPPFIGRRRLRERFVELVERIEDLDKLGKINVRLFEHYPTSATLILDNNIFVYPYGYHVLGTKSPVTWIHDDGGPDARFHRENAELVRDDSVPASMVVKALREPNHCDRKWTLAAVYIIPDRRTSLYRFGSDLIGYDIHRERMLQPRSCPVPGFRDAVGETAKYGFHLTLADALYFATDAAIDRVKAELLFLSREFSPFDLTAIHPGYPFHGDRKMLALQCEDPSGRAEALHHEIVSRIYRLAISSTYRTRKERRVKAKIDRRFRLMLQRYGAPYILRQYDPHFTLASNCPPDEAAAGELARQVETVFGEKVRRPSIRVRELALVVKKHNDTHWRIEKRFPLQD